MLVKARHTPEQELRAREVQRGLVSSCAGRTPGLRPPTGAFRPRHLARRRFSSCDLDCNLPRDSSCASSSCIYGADCRVSGCLRNRSGCRSETYAFCSMPAPPRHSVRHRIVSAPKYCPNATRSLHHHPQSLLFTRPCPPSPVRAFAGSQRWPPPLSLFPPVHTAARRASRHTAPSRAFCCPLTMTATATVMTLTVLPTEACEQGGHVIYPAHQGPWAVPWAP